jgi:hypothetical protein
MVVLKYIFVSITLLGILFQGLAKSYVLIKFELNQEYIAKNLCIKKEVPGNCCQGNCQLTKDLDAENKKEQSSPIQILKNTVDIQFVCTYDVLVNFKQYPIQCQYANFVVGQTAAFPKAIFHPPSSFFYA